MISVKNFWSKIFFCHFDSHRPRNVSFKKRERSEPHAQGEERRKGSFLISVQKKRRREDERVRQVENGLFFFPPPVKKERREESSHPSRASIAAD